MARRLFGCPWTSPAARILACHVRLTCWRLVAASVKKKKRKEMKSFCLLVGCTVECYFEKQYPKGGKETTFKIYAINQSINKCWMLDNELVNEAAGKFVGAICGRSVKPPVQFVELCLCSLYQNELPNDLGLIWGKCMRGGDWPLVLLLPLLLSSLLGISVQPVGPTVPVGGGVKV